MRSPLTADEIRARISAGATSGARARDAWRETAAVWMYFDLPSLRPATDDATGRPTEVLAGDCLLVRTRAGRFWTLKPELRVDALRRMIERSPTALTRAIEANPRERETPLNATFLDLLHGRALDLGAVPAQDLATVREMVRLLSRLIPAPALPSLEAMEARMRREEFLLPLRVLTEGFVGREGELRALRSYVDVLASKGWVESAQRAVSRLVEHRPAFVVTGRGGIGKSSLVGKFLLEHLDGTDTPIPFAYLDMERAELSEGRPAEIVRAIAAQLVAFQPEHAQWLQRFVEATPSEDTGLVSDFALTLGEIAGGPEGRGALLVLDTFEVFQRRAGPPLVARLVDLLTLFQQHVGGLRVVVSGRAPADDVRIGDKKPETLVLGGLDTAAAVARILAVRRGAERVPVSKDVAERVVAQVGTSPLSLTLAAKLLESTPDDDLSIQSSWWRRLADVEIQGFLYKRLLDRIEDEQVRKATYPGMAVRRLDADVVLHVLSGACGLDVDGLAGAESLLRRIRADVSLVAEEEDGSLRFRPDLRFAMLRAAKGADAERIAEVHRLAVSYYSSRTSTADRVEEVYHRLWRGDVDEAGRRLPPGTSLGIGEEVELLPSASRRFLEARQRDTVAVPETVLLGMLEKGDYDGVVRTYEANPGLRRGAPVPLARAFARQGRKREARDVALEALGVPGRNEAFSPDALSELEQLASNDKGHAVDRAEGFRRLEQALLDMFSADELRRFARYGRDGEQVANSLPGTSASSAAVTEAFVESLDRRGLIDAGFFARLRQERPGRATEIDALERSLLG